MRGTRVVHSREQQQERIWSTSGLKLHESLTKYGRLDETVDGANLKLRLARHWGPPTKGHSKYEMTKYLNIVNADDNPSDTWYKCVRSGDGKGKVSTRGQLNICPQNNEFIFHFCYIFHSTYFYHIVVMYWSLQYISLDISCHPRCY